MVAMHDDPPPGPPPHPLRWLSSPWLTIGLRVGIAALLWWLAAR